MDIVGITVCVNFDDILAYTIDQNSKLLKELYIVTAPNDTATIELLNTKNLPNVKVLLYDKFYDNSKFNKGGAVRFAQKYLYELYGSSKILLLDADIYLPDSFLYTIPSTLEPDILYGVKERLDYYTLDDFLNRKNHVKCFYGSVFVGFFQLYMSSPKYMYVDSDSCCSCDNDFRDLFNKRIHLNLSVAHLGIPQVNWEGRDYTKCERM